MMDARFALTMNDSLQLLAALQHGDSFFPAGGIAFSWGIETLVGDSHIGRQDTLAECVAAQLALRWNAFDRPFLVAAYQRTEDHAALEELDRELEAMMLAREARDGSRRAGTSLLLVHERIETPGAAAYRQRLNEGRALGHLAVVQALVWKGVGMSEHAVQSVSAYAFCVGMIGASLRLGVLGHLGGQQILTRMRAHIAELLHTPAIASEHAHTFAPAAEIAMMRHEVQSSRLFAN